MDEQSTSCETVERATEPRARALADKDVWRQVIIDGISTDQAMVGFAWSDAAGDAEAAYVYVASKSQLLAKQEGGH